MCMPFAFDNVRHENPAYCLPAGSTLSVRISGMTLAAEKTTVRRESAKMASISSTAWPWFPATTIGHWTGRPQSMPRIIDNDFLVPAVRAAYGGG